MNFDNKIIKIKCYLRIIKEGKKRRFNLLELLFFVKNKVLTINLPGTNENIINIKNYHLARTKEKIIIQNDNTYIEITDYTIKDVININNNQKEENKRELEIDIQEKIIREIKGNKEITYIGKEYVIPFGRIDILALKENVYYIYEIKKNELKIEDIYQIKRYGDYFEEQGFEAKMILIGKMYSKDLQRESIKHKVLLKMY